MFTIRLTPQKTPKFHWADLTVLLGLLLAGYKYTFSLETVTDVGLYDETNYLSYGLYDVASGSLPVAEWAPLYTIWYFLLSQWQPDALALYYLNYQILTTMIGLVTYLVLRSSGIQNNIAAPMAFLSLLSYANLPAWPKVSHFALIILLIFFSVSFFLKSQSMRILMMLFGALVISYVRPEFFLTAMLLTVTLVVVILFTWERLPVYGWYAIGATAVAAFVLLWGFGMPVGQGRSFLAFEQHFAWNWVNWTGSSLSPWTNTHEITQLVFGDVETIGGALLSNPGLSLRHILQNITLFPVKLIGLSFVHAPLFLRSLPYTIEGYLLLGGITLLLLVYHRRILPALRTNFTLHSISLVIALCFLLPGLLSTVFIHPRTHYLLTGAILLPLCLVWLLVPNNQQPLRTKWVVGMVILGLVVTPATPAWYRDTYATPQLDTIEFMKALAITEQVNILEAEGGYDVYLGENFTRIPEYTKSTGFDVFHRENQINMIVATDKLKNDSRFVNDAKWQAFLRSYETWQYIGMNIPNTDVLLLVHEALLEK